MSIAIRKLTEHIGAEVQGVDIASPIGDKTSKRLGAALVEHGVLVFRDQEITDDQHVAFTERFGRLEKTMKHDPIGDNVPIGVISNLDEHGDIIPPEDPRMQYTVGNTLWHSDGAFRPVPLRASFLAAKVVPPDGGGTEFASLCAAYAALSEEKKASLEGLVAEHSLAYSRGQTAPELMSEDFLRETPPTEQPVVRTIPETEQKALFVGSYAMSVNGWELEKGRALLGELLEWSTQPRFVYRHAWRANDLVAYDNRCCLHRGQSWDRARHKRLLHRTTLAGP